MHDVKLGENGKLRVGFISSDFMEHAQGCQVGTNFFELMRGHFDVYLYSTRMSMHPQALKIKNQVKHWRDLSATLDADAARLIASDNLAVLVDMTGWVDEAKPELIAMRPAPLIVEYLGFPGTFGSKISDYFVCDRVSCDESIVAPQFTEKFIYMPHTYQLTEHRDTYKEFLPASKSEMFLDYAIPQ